MPENSEISYSQELIRKGIHLFSLLIPICYYFLSRKTALSILIPLTVIAILIDIFSKKDNKFRYYFRKIFGNMLRSHEVAGEHTLNGATWVLISACFCVLIFPKILTVTGFSILIISDISAALIGRKFGKRRIFEGKSLEGTTAFIISAFIVIFIIGQLVSAPVVYYIFGCISSVVGGIAEASSRKMQIDDNLTIPISIGFLMWGGALISEACFHINFLSLM